ncbi:hypothetical protein SUGI_1141340 [Cryptomeria japonica]|nr:hypothetical protein SUGI_1141340 [Cryptomeria japonica]
MKTLTIEKKNDFFSTLISLPCALNPVIGPTIQSVVKHTLIQLSFTIVGLTNRGSSIKALIQGWQGLSSSNLRYKVKRKKSFEEMFQLQHFTRTVVATFLLKFERLSSRDVD